MALWLALDQVSETERVARQAGRLRPMMGQVAAPLFSTFLPELVVSDLGLDGNAHSGQAASCRALDFTTRPLRKIPLPMDGGTIHADVLKIYRRGSFKD